MAQTAMLEVIDGYIKNPSCFDPEFIIMEDDAMKEAAKNLVMIPTVSDFKVTPNKPMAGVKDVNEIHKDMSNLYHENSEPHSTMLE